MTQDGAGKLGEEAFDEVEPGAMLGRERKVEAACRSCVEPGSGFPRDVCGMIVEDQLDRGAGRKGGIEKLFFSKFARSVLRHIRVASKHELKERIMAGIDDVNRHPVIHTWSYKLA